MVCEWFNGFLTDLIALTPDLLLVNFLQTKWRIVQFCNFSDCCVCWDNESALENWNKRQWRAVGLNEIAIYQMVLLRI